MRTILAAAIISAIALTTAWSMSMLPRARDVAATMQTSGRAAYRRRLRDAMSWQDWFTVMFWLLMVSLTGLLWR